ncbi:MAG: N-acetylmuramoyl-L-alanine amidase, partial [Leptospiraceae bacterium]|nr:N-acetylmuramoyl-L-alanine amidase [Leptospiraceae bacterium]
IDEKQGIFTHMQAKKRYGYFSELTECGGEKLIKLILENIGGEFFSEEKWYNRFERYWIARKEKISSYKPGKKKFDRGRGITKQKPLLLESLEKNEEGFTPEEYRLQYEFKQSIEPSCIVLHYTAIPSFKRSQEVLEMRGLSASIMVDDDGKAYQLVDTLNDMSQAASGTNDKCIQVEIVARNTDDLMKNEIQSKKVTELVKEISKKFEIEITNEKIESFNGVFSHTQAKKKFGGSSALIGKEFDPGEIYMEKIIKGAGGKFYKEENWFNRNSEDWVMIFKDFQP